MENEKVIKDQVEIPEEGISMKIPITAAKARKALNNLAKHKTDEYDRLIEEYESRRFFKKGSIKREANRVLEEANWIYSFISALQDRDHHERVYVNEKTHRFLGTWYRKGDIEDGRST